ncbi:hypothetical protein FKM82_018508 [Ascaphus truei]
MVQILCVGNAFIFLSGVEPAGRVYGLSDVPNNNHRHLFVCLISGPFTMPRLLCFIYIPSALIGHSLSSSSRRKVYYICIYSPPIQGNAFARRRVTSTVHLLKQLMHLHVDNIEQLMALHNYFSCNTSHTTT